MLFSAWISSSQPLHEPASTSRIESERPSRRCAARSTCRESSASAASSAAGARSGEAGDEVSLDRCLEQRPLEPGRVTQVCALDAAVGTDSHPGEDVAAKSFNE